jgi:hypothetical protein
MDANRPGAGKDLGPDVRVGAHGVSAEKDVVGTPVVVGLFAVLAGLAIFGAVVVAVVFFVLEKGATRRDTAAVAEAGLERPAPDRLPPAPRLEIHTVGRFHTFRDAEVERLSTYGWMDRATGAVHLPIDRAMDLIIERGVGPLPPPPLQVVAPAPAAQTNPPPVAGSPEKKQ